MAETLREHCQRRLCGLKSARNPFEAEWRDIARFAAPSRSRFLNTEAKRRRSPVLLDEYGIYSFRTLTGGMTSGLSSPSRPWFSLTTTDELMEDHEVREWLSEVEKRMYAFFARSNFYGAVKTGYGELGLFGTEACVMVEHQTVGAVCHPLTIGEYWIATSDALMADTLYRRVPMSARQAVNTFGDRVSSRVRGLYDRSCYDDIVNVFHAIEPNRDRDSSRIDAANKPWRSTWWDEDAPIDQMLRVSGFDEQPFWAPRWDTIDNDAYGYAPGMDALPSLRELQLQSKRRNEAIDHLVKPEKLVNATIKLTGQPGSNISVAGLPENAVQIAYQMPYQAVEAIGEQIANCRQQIDRASYADLFMAITNMQGIQPRNLEEIASRNEEKLTQLGPVIERVNTEKLGVAIDRAFGIMQRGQLLPPAPESLHDANLDITFVSILTQMQRMVGIGQIERTVSFIGGLAAAFPEAVDKLDVDEMIDEYAERAGTPQKIIRTADQVQQIRDQRAQQQRMQQLAASMPAVKDGADAARLLSETAANGAATMPQAYAQ